WSVKLFAIRLMVPAVPSRLCEAHTGSDTHERESRALTHNPSTVSNNYRGEYFSLLFAAFYYSKTLPGKSSAVAGGGAEHLWELLGAVSESLSPACVLRTAVL